ncbi:hypothetical protein D3C85_1214850 [compost metagenome]
MTICVTAPYAAVAWEPCWFTSARITSSDSDNTTICNPVGKPMRSTLPRIATSSFIAAKNSRSGASGWPLPIKRHASNPIATRLPTNPAIAAL